MPDFAALGDGPVIALAAILALLLLSAFFSGSETALTAASDARLHQLALRGHRRARIVRELRQQNETLLGAILIGNNIANIAASALATSVLIAMFGEAGVAYATIGMTTLVVIFAEVLPKTWALNRADRTALAVAPAVRVAVWVLKPASAGARAIVRGAFGLFGLRVSADFGPEAREEELRGLIDMHRGPEPEIGEERAMLRGILDLDQVLVEEVMTHRRNVASIDADLPLERILEAAMESPYTRIPLYRGSQDEIVGVLHIKGLLRALGNPRAGGPGDLDIEKVASPPWFIPDSINLLDQLRAFRARREHFAVVVDEYGTFQGVVTLEDILEEIVGDIDDEHDVSAARPRRQPDGSFVVAGTATIRDLNRELDWSLPDEEATTVAGLVLHEARTIPAVGQEFLFHGVRFTVLRRSRNQVTQLRVRGAEPD